MVENANLLFRPIPFLQISLVGKSVLLLLKVHLLVAVQAVDSFGLAEVARRQVSGRHQPLSIELAQP